MKIKHAIILLALGFCLDYIATLFKIMHWANADILFITATILKVAGVVLFIAKLLTQPKVKEFLNW